MATNKAMLTKIRIRFLDLVLGTFSGPHSPTVGCTRGGVFAFRFRLLKIFGTPTL